MFFNRFKSQSGRFRSTILLLTAGLLASEPAQAIVPPDYKDSPDKPWSGRIGFGYHFNKNNKTTTSIDTKAEIDYEGETIDHSLIFSTLYTEDDFEPTNNKLRLEFQTDRDLANDHYMFFRADLENNQYGSLKAILEASDLKESLTKKLTQSIDQMDLARKLLTLKQDIPLGFNLKDIRLTMPSSVAEINANINVIDDEKS